jgi:hypothetical protein
MGAQSEPRFVNDMFHHSVTSAAVVSRQIDKGISLLKIATGVVCAESDEVRPFRHQHTIPERVRIHPRESAIISTRVVHIHEVGEQT